ncbi:hypothetical protein WA158_006714 [Blastocystis sp. Blastoise]
MQNNNRNKIIVTASLAALGALGVYYLYKKSKKATKKEKKVESPVENEEVTEKVTPEDNDVVVFTKPEELVEKEKETLDKVEKSDESPSTIEKKPVEVIESTITPSQEDEEKKKKEEEQQKQKEEEQQKKKEELEQAIKEKTTQCTKAFGKAKKLFNQQKYQEAIDVFTEALSLCPESRSTDMKMIYYSRASCHKKLSEYDAALEDLNASIVIDPLYSKAFYSRSQVYEARQELEKAIDDLAYGYVIDTLYNSQNTDLPKGMNDLVTVVANKLAKQTMNEKQNQKDTAFFLPSSSFIRCYLSSLQSEQYHVFNVEEQSIEELTTLIVEKTEKKEEEEKKETFSKEEEEYISLCNEIGTLYTKRGEAYKNKYQYQQCLEDYEMADQLGCDNRGYLCLELGSLYHLEGNYELAYKYYMENKEICGESFNLLIKLGGYYYEIDQVEESVSSFTHAVESYPDSPDGYYHRGQLYTLMANKDEEAMQDFEKCLSLCPSFAPVYMQLAAGYLKLGNVQKCHEYIDKCIELDPKSSQSLNQYGEILLLEGNGHEAEQMFDKAIECDATWPASYLNLSTLYTQGYGDLHTGEQYLLKAIDKDPYCIQAYCQLSSYYLIQKDLDNCTRCIEKAISIAHTERDLTQIYSLKITTESQIKAMNKLKLIKPHLVL